MLGIGVTTRERPALVEYGVLHIMANTPADYKLVVVDDNSSSPPKLPGGILIQSPRRLGVAEAKNACLWALSACDPIILLDDDVWPIDSRWLFLLTKGAECAGIHHLVYSPVGMSQKVPKPWDTHFHIMKSHVCGSIQVLSMDNCGGMLLYMTQTALRAVGAFNKFPGPYGFEHPAYSQRIWRAGLQAHLGPYCTVAGLDDYLWSLDFKGKPPDFEGVVASCMSTEEAQKSVQANGPWFGKSQQGPIKIELYNPLEQA